MHNSSRRGLAQEMRHDGLIALEEFTAPSLTTIEKGQYVDGIADIAVRPPWSGQHVFLDLTFPCAAAPTNRSSMVQEVIERAAGDKINRYHGRMIPLAFSDKGRPSLSTIDTLFVLANMAATQDTCTPGRMLNRWLCSLEVARAAAMAETLLLVAGAAVAPAFPRACLSPIA